MSDGKQCKYILYAAGAEFIIFYLGLKIRHNKNNGIEKKRKVCLYRGRGNEYYCITRYVKKKKNLGFIHF